MQVKNEIKIWLKYYPALFLRVAIIFSIIIFIKARL
tara:strand:- start:428 stop:535 length:108 start_codon:yes stop_codon:yes gene_type:complete